MSEAIETKRPQSPTIPRPIGEAIEWAYQVADAVDNHGISLGLKGATGGEIRRSATGLKDAETVFQEAVAKHSKEISPALKAANADAVQFIRGVKKPMSFVLGDRWNPAYVEAGFLNGNLQCPGKISERVALMDRLSIFLKKHPECEAEKHQITAARAAELYQKLSAAFQASIQHDVARKESRAVRDSANKAMRKLLADVTVEVRRKLCAASPAWNAFGLQAPKPRIRKSNVGVAGAKKPAVAAKEGSPALKAA
jgi:hypothetical protein